MLNKPLVSIIMNCYNGENFVREAIDSVVSQTYRNWEIIFWDNASIDNSYLIAQSYGPKIRSFKAEQNTSLGEARVKAVEQAKGDWLAFLDVDDVWLPRKLELQLAGLATGDYLLSYGGIHEVDKQLNFVRELRPRWTSGLQLRSQLLYFEINLVTSMVDRKKLLQLGLNFDPSMQASEEYNLYMKLLPHGSVYVCDEIIAMYRVYDESLTYQKIDRLALERRLTLSALAESSSLVSNMDEFVIATRQADYYEACALMNKKDFSSARSLIVKHTSSLLFKGLYILTFAPSLWRFCHNPLIKRRLSTLLRLN
ncbi:glycosyltransferase [Gammaproteobacteria bacterium]|nr:glycosyltransferase [Gammaproteobacteria bacterium]